MTALKFTPSVILRQLLVDLGVGTMPDPTTPTAWPIYAESMPNSPDSMICVYTTQGVLNGSVMTDGEVQEHFGFNIKVSSARPDEGWSKAQTIINALDKTINRNSVSIGPFTFLMHAITRSSGIIPLGKGIPTNKQNTFSINGTMSLTQSS